MHYKRVRKSNIRLSTCNIPQNQRVISNYDGKQVNSPRQVDVVVCTHCTTKHLIRMKLIFEIIIVISFIQVYSILTWRRESIQQHQVCNIQLLNSALSYGSLYHLIDLTQMLLNIVTRTKRIQQPLLFHHSLVITTIIITRHHYVRTAHNYYD